MPDFWTRNQNDTNKVMKELKQLRGQLVPFQALERQCGDLLGLLEITEESDAVSLKHLEDEAAALEKNVAALEFQKLLSGPSDRNSSRLAARTAWTTATDAAIGRS